MVDKEKVLKGLESCADRTGALCRTCPYDFVHNENCMGDIARDALELLKEQQKQRFFVDSDGKITPLPIQPQWISMKDRLPDKQPCEYLVVNGNNVETAICLDNRWITPRRVTKITHWMPLPEPPKESEKE